MRLGRVALLPILVAAMMPSSMGAAAADPSVLSVSSVSPARVDFTLDEAVRVVTVGPESEQVAVEGSGSAYGAVIVDQAPGEQVRAFFALAVDHVCLPVACGEERVYTSSYVTSVGYQEPSAPGEQQRSHVLEPGDYILFLITDGSPVTVRLTADGFGEDRHLVPTRAAPVLWSEFEAAYPLSLPGLSAAWGAHSTSSFRAGHGVAFSAMTIDSETASIATKRMCAYAGRPSLLTLVHPACPDGTLPAAQESWLGAGGSHSVLYGGVVAHVPGDWTTSYRVEHLPGKMSARARGFWLDAYAP